MNTYKHLAIICVTTLLAQCCSTTLQAQQPRKLAFVVGVSKYQKTGLSNLKYAHKDANDLSAELQRNGFEVTKLIGSEAKHEQVRTQLDAFFEKTSDLGKSDVVLLSFSGHGVQKEIPVDGKKVETPFVCVYDTLVKKPETMVSLNWVKDRLQEDSGCGSNLLIVDACRNNPNKGARTLDGGTVRNLPENISLLLSSASGQKSFESDKVRQGVFTYVLLKGLRGDAANSRGQVKWGSLATYVLEEVPVSVAELMGDASIRQRPNLVGNMVRSPVLNSSTNVPLLVAPFGKKEIDAALTALGQSKGIKPASRNNIGMEFRLVPAGEFKMGSLESEEGRGFDEKLHTVKISNPFYIGVSEVTQKEWKSIMGTEPWLNAEYVKKGDKFPATYISWDEAIAFCEKLSLKEGRKYRLPKEAEWEYACRGGTSTAFSFGGQPESLGNYGWFDKNADGIGQCHAHTVKSKLPNGFGIFDMHGNCLEWCLDDYVDQLQNATDPLHQTGGTLKVNRGGSWYSLGQFCRSGFRSQHEKTTRDGVIGFRVVNEVEK